MSSTSNASTRICPVCNAPNSSLSLFCAECGSSLNVPDGDDTASYTPLATDRERDVQETAAFEPGGYPATTPAVTTADTAPPADDYRTSWDVPAATSEPAPITSKRSPAPGPVRFTGTTEPHGIRGFVLGTIAVVLMLAVFGTWTWAALLSQDTRESIRNIFGFIG